MGLDPGEHYRIGLIRPQGWQPVISPCIIDAMDLMREGSRLSGEALMQVGMQLPIALPETALLFQLVGEGGLA